MEGDAVDHPEIPVSFFFVFYPYLLWCYPSGLEQ